MHPKIAKFRPTFLIYIMTNKIKLVILDFDGVFTDKIYISSDGIITK